MKRQENELFFRYKAHQLRGGNDNIFFDLPDGFVPLPGDIIEMMVSENISMGYVTHYIKVVCFINLTAETFSTDLAAVDGRLQGTSGEIYILNYVNYNERDGRKYIDCYAPENSNVAFYPENEATYMINMIVHRTVGNVGLYYL